MQNRVFRGWWVLVGAFAIMTVGSGFAFYAQGVFLDALVVEQGFSVGMAGAGTGFFFVVSGIGGYYAGGLIGRFDVRLVMTVGAIVASIGLVLVGQIREPWQMFVVFLIYGGGYSMVGLVPATSIVTRWFSRQRAMALAIASTGLSMGGIAITPLIAKLIDERTLVDMAPWLAVTYLVGTVPFVVLLVRPSPQAMGLAPDGDEVAVPSAPTGPLPGVAFTDAVTSKYFKVLSVAFILVMAAQVGALQHLFKLTKDRVDIQAAGAVLMVVTATSVVGRLVGGVSAKRFALAHIVGVLIVVQAVGIVLLAVAESLPMILIGSVVLGSAMGNLLMLHPLLLAEAFGIRDYPRIYGLGALLMVSGVGLGPLAVGVLRDMTSYRTAFLIMAAIGLGGLAVFRVGQRDDRAVVAPATAAAKG